MSWWVMNGRRRVAGPFESEEQALQRRQLEATHLHGRLVEKRRAGLVIDDEEIRRRLRSVRVVERASSVRATRTATRGA